MALQFVLACFGVAATAFIVRSLKTKQVPKSNIHSAYRSTHKAAFDALKRQRTAIRTSRFPDRKFDSNIFANVERPKVETTEATENQPKVQPAQPETIESDEHFVGGFEEKMTFEEACLILGLSPKDSSDVKKLTAAHRKIMLRNHPDRGGSPHLATKINEAKELLVKLASSKQPAAPAENSEESK